MRDGRRFPFETAKSPKGKDPRPCLSEYRLLTVSATTSMELFAQSRSLPEILEEVARLGAQLLMQAALEAEVTEFLGRDRYQRAAASPDARPGSRNGYGR